MPGRRPTPLPTTPSSPEEAFGIELRTRRLALGLTQADLEARSRVERSFISQLETGQRQVCFRQFVRLAYALDLSPGEFMTAAEQRFTKAIRRELKAD